MIAILKRKYSDKQTIGKLEFTDKNGVVNTFCALERPWVNNTKSISCIPEGKYIVNKHYSPTFKECFRIVDVPGRSEILIHHGNYVNDTKGCILVGMNHIDLNKDGLLDVSYSRIAMNKLLLSLPRTFELIVTCE